MTADLASPFAWLGPDGLLSEMTGPYWRSWVTAMGLLGWASLPRRGAASLAERPGGDATYFTSVLFWVYETAVRAHESLHWGHYSTGPLMPWKVQAVVAAAVTLAVLVVCSLAAEAVARRRGRPARAAGASVPLPVLAAVGSAFGVWMITLAPFCWR